MMDLIWCVLPIGVVSLYLGFAATFLREVMAMQKSQEQISQEQISYQAAAYNRTLMELEPFKRSGEAALRALKAEGSVLSQSASTRSKADLPKR